MMRISAIVIISITLPFIAPADAWADALPADPPIIVLGRGLDAPPGTPAYGSVEIDRRRLTDEASGRIENILRDVAGFQQFRRSDSRSANPSAQGATLRALGGNASSRALVLLDGVPMADPFFGYIPFNAIAPGRLSSARVTRGGGAGAFGAGAIAGTIELESATRSDLPDWSAAAAFGSRDAQEQSVGLAADVGTGPDAGFVSIATQRERGDGFFTTPPAQRVSASVPARYRDWSGELRAIAPIDARTQVQARGLIFRDDRTLRFAGADSRSTGADASIRLIHSGDWGLDALAYVQARNFSNVVISSTSFRRALDQRSTPSTGIGGKIELRPPVSASHVLRVGIDMRLADGDNYEDPYNATTALATARRHGGGKQSVVGGFVEDDWTLGALIITGGARVDRWTISNGFFQERDPAGALTADTRYPGRAGWEATGRLGAVWKLDGSVSLRAAAYSGFRLSTLNELYRSFAIFPVTTRANAALALEKLRGVEAGFELRPAHWLTLSGTVFYNRLGGAISNITIGTNLKQRQNVDAIVARGVELSAQVREAPFSLIASYSLADSKVQASGLQAQIDGFTPAQSPRDSASATIGWDRRGYALSASLRYVGRQYEDDLQTDSLPSAITVDATARLPIRQGLSLIGRAENIFDAAVVTRNQGGSIDIGTPRTIWLGVRIEG